MKQVLLLVAYLSALQSAVTHAQVPMLVNYQGFLVDSVSGSPVDSAQDLTLSIYNSYDSNGTNILLYIEVHPNVSFNQGVFNVLIGNGIAPNPLPSPAPTYSDIGALFDTGADVWLEVKVGSDLALTPRHRIVSAAYSIHSKTADSAIQAQDVPNQDITPQSVSIAGYGPVIDNAGNWLGVPQQGPEGPPGPPGPEGPQGIEGPPGPVITTSAVCVNASYSGITYSDGYCSCAGNTVSRVTSSATNGCTATSDTGSCSASGYPGHATGQCCVCAP